MEKGELGKGVVATRSRKQTQKGNADSGVQFITPTGPRQSLLLAKDPRPVFVETLYTLSVCAQTHLPKFLETSLGQGKREIRSKLIHDSCVTRPDKQWTFINRPVVISR